MSLLRTKDTTLKPCLYRTLLAIVTHLRTDELQMASSINYLMFENLATKNQQIPVVIEQTHANTQLLLSSLTPEQKYDLMRMPLSDTGLTKATQSVGEYPNPVEKTVLLQINSLQ